MKRVLKYSLIASAVGTAVVVGVGWWKFKKVSVVWDLDKTIIFSRRIGFLIGSKSPRRKKNSRDELLDDKKKKKEQQILRVEKTFFEHIDDDLIHFRTDYRPYTKFVLKLLSLFTNQYVYTSSSHGYMVNILRVLDPKGNLFKKSQARDNKIVSIPILKRYGKDVRVLNSNIDLKKAILIDDQIYYHKAQRDNGFLISQFNEKSLGKKDNVLLRLLLIIFICSFIDDVRSILPDLQPKSYKEYFKRRDMRRKRKRERKKQIEIEMEFVEIGKHKEKINNNINLNSKKEVIHISTPEGNSTPLKVQVPINNNKSPLNDSESESEELEDLRRHDRIANASLVDFGLEKKHKKNGKIRPIELKFHNEAEEIDEDD